MNPSTSTKLSGEDFPMLGGIALEFVESRAAEPGQLKPKHIDEIAREIGRVLRQASVPESTLSRLEVQKSEVALVTVIKIHWKLQDLNKLGNARAGAMDALLSRSIITQDNLEALLKMMNSDIRSGRVRCSAVRILSRLTIQSSIWDVPLADGRRFSSRLILACAESLDVEVHTKSSNLHTSDVCCNCVQLVPSMLMGALTITKGNKSEIIHGLVSYNWKDILEQEVVYICDSNSAQNREQFNHHVYNMMNMFTSLHQLAIDAWQKDPGSASSAKTILRKLGESHKLFHSVLRQIISGEFLSPEKGLREGRNGINLVMLFLNRFFHCLTPPPMGPETDALVRLAYPCLERARDLQKLRLGRSHPLNKPTTDFNNAVCQLFQDYIWRELKEESDQDRLGRFQLQFFQDTPEGLRETRKHFRKFTKEIFENRSRGDDYTTEQMCANCFRLESDIGPNCNLQRCARCRQISYCSRACQVQHWHKVHKGVCKKK